MKKKMMLLACVALAPLAATAQDVPLYVETDGQLSFSGDMLDEAALAELLGASDQPSPFEKPNFVAKDVRNGTLQPVWASLEDYELLNDGDGIIENRHDDLVFDESEAQEPPNDISFKEDEGSDLREDLDFNENEGTDTRDDLTFSPQETLVLPDNFDDPGAFFAGERPDFLQPRHGVWAISLTQSDAIGCPPGIAELATAQLGKTGAKDIIFSEPGWTPADLNPDYANYRWAPVGTNGFMSEPYSTGPAAEGSGVALTVTLALDAKSAQQIDVWAKIRMDLAPNLAAIAGGSTTCIAIINGTYRQS